VASTGSSGSGNWVSIAAIIHPPPRLPTLHLLLQVSGPEKRTDTHEIDLAGEVAAERDRLATPTTEHSNRTRLAPIRAAFDLSYQRLSPAAASLLLLLSVNPGPEISTEAAAAVSSQPVGQARACLADLARASLLKEQPAGSERWRLHELIRSYATDLAEHMINSEARAEALDLLLKHYQSAARDATRSLSDAEPVATSRYRDGAHARGWLDGERTSLIAAVRVAATTGHEAIAVSLARSILPFLVDRYYNEDAITVGRMALSAARRMGDRLGEAALLNSLGLALKHVRRLSDAITCHQDMLAITRELGDRRNEVVGLNNLGIALWEKRQHAEALTIHRQAAAISRELGNRTREAVAVNELGTCLREMGRIDEALAAHQEAVVIFREVGARHSEGLALNNIGIVLQEMSRFDEAITSYRDALAITRELGDRHGEAAPLTNLANTLRRVRRFGEAIVAHEQVLVIYQELGDRFSEAEALGNLGAALHQVRRFGEAITAEKQAVAIFAELGDHQGEARALAKLGAALLFKRRFGAAITTFRRHTRILQELGELPPTSPDPSNLHPGH
jgi:tetratricopeptide (TPR) repeat protein